MILFDFALFSSFFCCILYVEQLLFLDVLFLVILFAFFVGRFFPDSHSSALVRISLRFERTEVRSLPLFLSFLPLFLPARLSACSFSPTSPGVLNTAWSSASSASLCSCYFWHSFSPFPKFGQPFSSRAFRSSPGCTFLELAFFWSFHNFSPCFSRLFSAAGCA